MKTYCFKLYNSNCNKKLKRQINAAGLIYNHCIALHRRYYRLWGKFLKKYDLQHHLVKLKKQKKFSYIKEIDAQAVQNIVERIDRAYNLFWSNKKRGVKASPPKFKKVRKYKSFTLKQHNWKLMQEQGKIIIKNQEYKYFQSRLVYGRIKTVTVKRDGVGDIYIYLVSDHQDDIIRFRTGESVGYDFGLKRFLTASNGKDIESPLFFARNSKIIKAKHRNLSHKQEHSHHHKEAQTDLARAYRKSSNQRKDFHFKTARNMCKEYAVICIETLNIKGMARLWGRKIHDLGFYSFVQILKYEASKFGTRIVEIDKFYPSSQLCSSCGYKNPEVKSLEVREWICPKCGMHHDRDRNAAVNILRVGASTLAGGIIRPEQSGCAVDSRIHSH